jgi:hypothetical protein
MPMTRAEAVCACRNTIEAIEALDEILPAEYSRSVHDRTKSTLEYIMKTPQYNYVTEKMDSAIRNIWTGLQKWNRRGQANSDLFYGLADTITELANGGGTRATTEAEPDEEAVGMAAEMNPESAADFEATAREMLGELSEADKQRLAAMSAGAQRRTPPSVVPPPALVPSASGLADSSAAAGVGAVAFTMVAKFLQLAAKARENVISNARTRFHEKGINVVPVDKIKHGDLTPVLRLTTSERTRQCLEAAYTAGYIAGAKSTVEELEEQVRKNGT